MQERLEALSPEHVGSGDDDGRAQFYAACVAAIERLTEQLDRRDRALELKDERHLALDREIVQLRAAIVNLQRSNEDARSAYNTAATDRQRAMDRLSDEVRELRTLRDALRESDAARGALIEKNLALETVVADLRAELASVAALSKEITARNEAEIELTRAQIAHVDSMIAQIHRSFFWRLKARLSILRSPLRAVRAVVRR